MTLTLQVLNFKKSSNQNARFLEDFVQFIQTHNHTWFPISPFKSLRNDRQLEKKYLARLNAALLSISDEHENLNYSGRIGLAIDFGWAQEIVIWVANGDNVQATINFGIWPGNTKGQGWKVLHELNSNPNWQPPANINFGNENL